METKTDNELIAEFMGLDHNDSFYKTKGLHPHIPIYTYKEKLEFNSSWEWLMPVVEAIQKLNPNYELRLFINIDGWACNITHGNIYRTSYAASESQISAVFGSVVNFIKWYNSQRGGAINSKISAQ